ncbi:MAG: phosphoribosylamine--glycine ligase [Gemmatimonadaceae bacterium]|nr:phosphoribosylamine--glycine ligase [Gemmatimonadaceae bacterium]
MNVLILGGGGREHAVAWKLTTDDPSVRITAAPGNPGIEALGRCVRINPSEPVAVVSLAREVQPDLVFVGPEAPLAAGVSDALSAAGFAVFGPTRAAAQLESSKRYSKQLMLEHGIPTAGASWHSDASQAKLAVRLTGAPVVIKASGLAAGKGVVVCETVEAADQAIDDIMLRSIYGPAGAEVLVEEFMEGEEISVFAVSDGAQFVLLPAAQDHKRLLDGDLGPNTGGMGAYSPVSVATASTLGRISEEVIGPTLKAMAARGAPFRGLLYCGMMLTADGPKVVEYNCRFGDPETQVVLPVMDEELLPLLSGAASGHLGASRDASVSRRAAVCTVVAAPGYPEAALTGGEVVLPHAPDGVLYFHAGTARGEDGRLVASGGRVLAATAIAESFSQAAAASRNAAAAVRIAGGQFRRDIGWREQARRARAT